MERTGNLPSGCQTCSLAVQCLPSGMAPIQIASLEMIVGRAQTLKKGSYLYEQNASFKSIYSVRSGCVKTFTISESGNEQITGFYLPGELFGAEGIASGRHKNFASSLGTASVCEVDFQALSKLSAELPLLQKRLFQIMSREIVKKQNLTNLLSKSSGIQRVATFFMDIAGYKEPLRGLDIEFQLPMTKAASANYIGMTAEGFSRILSQMQDLGCISVEARLIKIIQLEKLKELMEGG